MANNLNRKILFIVPFYPDRSPSQRFRIENYISFFEQNGFICEFSSLITPKTDKIFYAKGKLSQKTFLLFKFLWTRYKDVLRASKYDIIFVQRESIFIGSTFFEKQFARKSKLVFDFDDAIWLPNVSQANKSLEWLKNYKKTDKIIALAHHVIAGNRYLAEYARKISAGVSLIPTTVDTNLFKRKSFSDNSESQICVGWSGSQTTVKHFLEIVPVLEAINKKYGNKVKLKLIGDENFYNDTLKLKGTKWSPEKEVEELAELDIGIMPLPDDKWAMGKCGLKGLTYMALEIPTIMSPVGVNTEIIQDGKNGFLASAESEWIEKISRLIENPDLRKQLGKAGRQTVVEKYSVDANKQKYFDVFNTVLGKR